MEDNYDVRSVMSGRSSRSNKSTSSQEALNRKARLAALELEQQFRQREEHLERTRLAAEHEARQLELEKQVAITRAELAVLNDSDEDVDPEVSFRPRQKGFVPQQPEQRQPERVITPPTLSNNCTIPVDRLVNSLNENLSRSQLPKLELKVFKGDPLEFQQWRVSFEKLVEEVTSDPVKRLHYLMQYTIGDANTLVSAYSLDQSENGYQSAKGELVKEFGDPYVLARAYLKTIEQWNPIRANDPTALKSLAAFLKKCRGSMPSLRHLQQLNTDLYLQKIVVKLPMHMQVSWRKAVNGLEEKGVDVLFDDLVNFVDKQSQIAKHPVFSAEALMDVDNKNKQIDNKSFLSSARRAKTVCAVSAATNVPLESSVLTAVTPSKPKMQTCLMCSKPHDLDDCNIYLSRTLDDRRKYLIENRLCFSCYGHTSKTHDARTCRRRRKCKMCGKLHPTGLHGYRRPVEHSSAVESNNIQSEETDLKTVTSCATDVHDESVALSVVMVRLSRIDSPKHELIVYAAYASSQKMLGVNLGHLVKRPKLH
jgi:hypothetical protein